MKNQRETISIEPLVAWETGADGRPRNVPDPLESGVTVEYDICICTKDAEAFRRELEAVFNKYRI